MAHNIGEMFYFGKLPWHGIGTPIAQPATLEEALKAGGIDWTVSMHPLALGDERESGAPQRLAVVRDDIPAGAAGRVLGVVHPQFKVLQNRQGAQLFDSLFGKGERVYHTGGYLKKGEVVWLMAKLPDGIVLPCGDKLDTYLLFSNSHDGSLPIDIRLTTVRVVCNNTLTLALRTKDQTRVFRRSHDGAYAVLKAEAEAFAKTVLSHQEETTADMSALINAKCSDDAFAAFLVKLLPSPTRPVAAETSVAVSRGHATRTATEAEKRQQIMEVHLNGHKVTGRPGVVVSPAEKNWWGALNSVTAWVDHVSEIRGDRLANAMFGKGDRLKTEAYHRILVAAKNA